MDIANIVHSALLKILPRSSLCDGTFLEAPEDNAKIFCSVGKVYSVVV